ncbi:MAG: CPBP family intramembrane metalloprotease [Planctomycetes bacterium]|nr:CPBP family intramembrane metalloprotease [Planctomycetota bacterium]
MLDTPWQPVGPLGAVYLLLIGLLLPRAVWKSGRRARDLPAPPRTTYILSALQTAAVLGGLGLWVARVEGLALFPGALPLPRDIGLGLLATVVLVLVLAPYRARIARRRDRSMQHFCEPTRTDRALWVVLSLSAGFWEELVYRGVLCTLLARVTGSAPLAVALALLAFTLGHLHRSWSALIPVAVIGLVLHAFVFLTGTLYVAMGVHLLYDVATGFAYMRLAAKHGITREVPPAGGPAPS